jgi:hypothetical protein
MDCQLTVSIKADATANDETITARGCTFLMPLAQCVRIGNLKLAVRSLRAADWNQLRGSKAENRHYTVRDWSKFTAAPQYSLAVR